MPVAANESIRCPISGSRNASTFLEIDQIPVFCNVLYPTQELALNAPRADLHLAYCPESGHVFNSAFDPKLVAYSEAYENSLHYSETFQEYAIVLADRLIDQYSIRNANVIDIGCGNGDFLNLICDRGSNRGFGFDPSYDADQYDELLVPGVRILPEYYSKAYTDIKADLITCRHVLEHIARPRAFMQELRATIAENTDGVLYFEVPNVRSTLQHLAIWDLIYEHCSYFSCTSLSYLFKQEGFDVTQVEETFGGQYLSLDARVEIKSREDRNDICAQMELLDHDVSSFETRFQKKMQEWYRLLRNNVTGKRRTVIWGAGSKGVTILNFLGITDEIEYVVDINPRKQGGFVPGTGQEIITPSYLSNYKPDAVIVMNDIYINEVRQLLKEMALTPEIILA